MLLFQAVSGVIHKTGVHHVGQICEAALLLREAFATIQTDGKMELLVGLHSGPVAVGIVGLKRPRYCL